RRQNGEVAEQWGVFHETPLHACGDVSDSRWPATRPRERRKDAELRIPGDAELEHRRRREEHIPPALAVELRPRFDLEIARRDRTRVRRDRRPFGLCLTWIPR